MRRCTDRAFRCTASPVQGLYRLRRKAPHESVHSIHQHRREVRDCLVRAADREHVELIVVDNRYQPKIALRTADYLIHEHVDLVVEFQTDEMIAPAIASKYMEARIPFIAIDIPHPGATYFGANNYQAGLMAGHFLGRWAKRHWASEPDEILLVELQRAGSLPKARIRGILTGVSEVMRIPEACRTVSIDGDGQFHPDELLDPYLDLDGDIAAHGHLDGDRDSDEYTDIDVDLHRDRFFDLDLERDADFHRDV